MNRVFEVFSKDSFCNTFKNEFQSTYELLSSKYNVRPLENINFSLVVYPKDDSNNNVLALTVSNDDGSYEIRYCPELAKGVWDTLLRSDGTKIYKTILDLIKNVACNEACHVICNELNNKDEDFYKKIYEPLRAKYTDVPMDTIKYNINFSKNGGSYGK